MNVSRQIKTSQVKRKENKLVMEEKSLTSNSTKSVSSGLEKLCILFVILVLPPFLYLVTGFMSTCISLFLEEYEISKTTDQVISEVPNNPPQEPIDVNTSKIPYDPIQSPIDFHALVLILMTFGVAEAMVRWVFLSLIYVFDFTPDCELGGHVEAFRRGYTMLDSIAGVFHVGTLYFTAVIIAHILL